MASRRADDNPQQHCAPPPLTPFTHLAHLGQPMPQPVYPWYPTYDSYLFGAPLASTSADLLSSLSRWSLGPPDFLLPFHPGGAIHPQEFTSPDVGVGFSPAPSDASSVQSYDSAPSPLPGPQPTHVVCNAPLVAPVPLPYHSPTFLQYDDLPDDDEDLSHPPYTRRPHKRKRTEDDERAQAQEDERHTMPAKRRSISGPDNQPYCAPRFVAPPMHSRSQLPVRGLPHPTGGRQARAR